MNKIDKVFSKEQRRNFYNHFTFSIIAFIISVFLVIAIYFMKIDLTNSVFFGIVTVLVLTCIIFAFDIYSFFSVFKDRQHYQKAKLFRINFALIIVILVCIITFIALVLTLNSFRQSLISAIDKKDSERVQQVRNYFDISKNLFFFFNSITIAASLVILTINIVLKKKN
ncbi:hypothetical protein OF363_00755 [Mycoplasma enhydrae]|uniref:hypothetical protein n=1 Tax=Mycoplasma enhydrae TaxID=2499220 RepID=UPI0021E6EDA3|nr:hypothetical protein [Mycoplasma enhydrae]MCV3733566.1 hypothetical protein [Mycoplasma enhydrae]